MKKTDKHCLVLLSGGQDSVTCLGIALGNYTKVSAISFLYGQRHMREVEVASDIAKRHNVNHRVVDVGPTFNGLVISALTDPTADDKATSKPHPTKPGLPASFVPGRNALFLVLAHAYAQTIGAGLIMTGVCQTDYSGYPDCRDGFVRVIQDALNIGYETNVQILTPLMFVDKAETFALAEEWGFLDEVLTNSLTCYNGDETQHEWGKGCGECPACKLRIAGYKKFVDDEDSQRRQNGRQRALDLSRAKEEANPAPMVAPAPKKKR